MFIGANNIESFMQLKLKVLCNQIEGMRKNIEVCANKCEGLRKYYWKVCTINIECLLELMFMKGWCNNIERFVQ